MQSFKVFAQLPGGAEFAENKGALESAADAFDLSWLPGVVLLAPDGVVENPHQVADVVVDVFLPRRAPLEHIEQFEVKPQPVPLDDDVFGVEVAVVFAQVVDALNARRQRVEQVEPLKGRQPLARLAGEKLQQDIPFDKLRNQKRHRGPAEGNRILRLILDHDGAVTELVQFFRVPVRDLVFGVAVGEEELGRALDAGGKLPDFVDFAFPAGSQHGDDFVLPGELPSGREIETVNHQFFCGVLRHA